MAAFAAIPPAMAMSRKLAQLTSSQPRNSVRKSAAPTSSTMENTLAASATWKA